MRRSIMVLIIALTCLLSTAVMAQAPPPSDAITADSVTDRMQSYYETVKVYSAEFKQDVSDISGLTQSSKGIVFFMKPGRMRWQYTSPDEKYLISNGKQLWAWEPAYKQYCEQDLQSGTVPTALTFLTGEGNIRKEFNVKLLDKAAAGTHAIELTPKNPNPNYQNIVFVVDATSFRVKTATVADALGNINKITFSDVIINEGVGEVKAEYFEFKAPADAKELCGQFKK